MSFDLKISNRDLVLQNGDFRTITDSEKLIQDILKICLTEAGSNPSFPEYGSYISQSLIGNAQDESIILTLGQSQLQNCLQLLMQMQAGQAKSGQSVSADEQIRSIVGINVSRDKTNPTFFQIKIQVVSKGLKPITTAFQVDTLT